MSRFIDFLSLGYGTEILPNIHITELDTIQELYHQLSIPLYTHIYPVTFYGYTIPPPKDSIFYAIMINDKEKIHTMLRTNKDINIKYKYKAYDTVENKLIPSHKKKYVVWNNITPLEMAILMENKEMVDILRSYNRTCDGSRNTIHGNHSIHLARLYHKHDIITQLQTHINV